MRNIVESCCTAAVSQGFAPGVEEDHQILIQPQQCCRVKHCSRSNNLSVYLSLSFSQDLDSLFYFAC